MPDCAQIRRFDKELPLPDYQTENAAAFDLASRVDVTIQPKEYAYVPLNVAIKWPQGYWGLLAARSSLHKKGLAPLNAIGVMDPDFCGDNNEYKAVLFNYTDAPVTVAKGERLMQVIPVHLNRLPIREVESLGEPDRGEFGSTD